MRDTQNEHSVPELYKAGESAGKSEISMEAGKTPDILLNAVIEGIERKKGLKIVKINLTKINHSECSYFVICHGNSSTHVEAIAHSVEDTVEEMTGEKVWHVDGYRNAIWILLDYADIMVHVFQHEARVFYDLENLWADATVGDVNIENQYNDR